MHEFEFWHVYRDINDAYVEDIDRLAQARHLLKPFDSGAIKGLEGRYGIELFGP